MLFIALAVIALGLTVAMFASRNAMLGFPSGIFWAVFGGYCYTLSTATWDVYYITFFASALGMTTFAIFGAFALREKRDTIADDEMDEDVGAGEGGFIDEQPAKPTKPAKATTRSSELHRRADARRKRYQTGA